MSARRRNCPFLSIHHPFNVLPHNGYHHLLGFLMCPQVSPTFL
ncbi:hypothetical protein GCWU000282_01975 [Catonella morbi ATCC 51271]|uniref:Uncharacterized protein n=1 Tax=Catonella morbi ATCC 51271 TaxID=592026 RepID=V2Y4W1_9FIRM|nr:hypothetical protein GCWU000282_01975 [Catonella morbi ATCC 51271]